MVRLVIERGVQSGYEGKSPRLSHPPGLVHTASEDVGTRVLNVELIKLFADHHRPSGWGFDREETTQSDRIAVQ